MKKQRKVHFVLADPNVSYKNMSIKIVRGYVEHHDVLACTPQLSDNTRVTMWARDVTCMACWKAMFEAGIVGSSKPDRLTIPQHQK